MNARKQAIIRDYTRNINEARSKGDYMAAVRYVSNLAIYDAEPKLALDFVQLMLDNKQDKEHEIYAGTKCGQALFECSLKHIKDQRELKQSTLTDREILPYHLRNIVSYVLDVSKRESFSSYYSETVLLSECDLHFGFDRIAFAVAVLRGYIFAMYPEHAQELDSSEEARLVFMSSARNQANIYKSQAV